MPNHEIGCLDHCPRGGGGGKGWTAVIFTIIAVVVIAVGYKFRHGIETGVDIGLWITGSVVGLILASLIGIAAVKITRHVRAVQVPQPVRSALVPFGEPAYRITQLGTRRTVRGAIEAPEAEYPETDPRYWLGDIDWQEPAPAPQRENPRYAAPAPEDHRSRAPRQEETGDDDARYRSRFR